MALCLWGLDARSVWLDEGISRAATTQLAETLDETGGTMGLYYALLDGWTEVFGASVTAMRLLSTLFVVATVVVAASVARRTLDRHEAMAATVAVALLPGLTRYGQEARSYALTALVASLSWYCLIRASTGSNEASRARSAWWVPVWILSAVGVLTHGMYVVQVVAQGVLVVVASPRDVRRFAPAGLTAVIVGMVLYRSGADHVAHWVPPLSADQAVDVARLLLHPATGPAIALGLLALLGALRQIRRAQEDPSRRLLHLVPVVWAVVPVAALFVLSLARPYFLPRYLLASAPAVGHLMAVGVLDVDRRVRNRMSRGWALGPVGFTAVLAAGLLLLGQAETHRERNQDWRGAAAVLADESVPGDIVLFTQPDLKLAFDVAWLELAHRPPVPPRSVRPPRPLGRPHRFDPVDDVATIGLSVSTVDRVWIVHQRLVSSRDQLLAEVLAVPELADDFTESRRWKLEGDLQVILLERQDR